MEETEVFQRKYNIELAKGNTNINEIKETLETLNKLFDTSGCKKQMCSVLMEKLPTSAVPTDEFEDLGKETYDILVAAELVGCFGKYL